MEAVKKVDRHTRIIRWIARISGSVFVLFLLMMFIGETLDSSGPLLPLAAKHVIGLLLMLGLIVGLVLAWRWELTGGLIAVVSIFALMLVLGNAPIGMLGFAIPGALFIIAHFRSKGDKPVEVEETAEN